MTAVTCREQGLAAMCHFLALSQSMHSWNVQWSYMSMQPEASTFASCLAMRCIAFLNTTYSAYTVCVSHSFLVCRMMQVQQPAQSADTCLTRPRLQQGRLAAAQCSKAPLQATPLPMQLPIHQTCPPCLPRRPQSGPLGRAPPEALLGLPGEQGLLSLLAGLCLSMGIFWPLLTAWHRGGCCPPGMTGKVCTVCHSSCDA